jgi:hypothetical protein
MHEFKTAPDVPSVLIENESESEKDQELQLKD